MNLWNYRNFWTSLEPYAVKLVKSHQSHWVVIQIVNLIIAVFELSPICHWLCEGDPLTQRLLHMFHVLCGNLELITIFLWICLLHSCEHFGSSCYYIFAEYPWINLMKNLKSYLHLPEEFPDYVYWPVHRNLIGKWCTIFCSEI